MAPPSLTRSFAVLFLFISYVSVAAGGYVGVNYGRVANNLMSPERVVRLLRDNGIGAAAIYDADPDVINAFRNSSIKLAVSLRNELLENAARSKDYAGDWVWHNVGKYYPAVQIDSIAVGNEVFHQRPELTPFLVAAMQNVYDAIANLGYADRIKISTPVAFSAVDRSFPPSQGSFRGELQPVIRQILEFLTRTDSYFMADIYPYFAYRDNYPDIPLDYTLGRLPNPGVRDPNTGLMYYSLLDAQLDAVYSAMAALGYGNAVTANATGGRSLQQPPFRRRGVLKETGYPSSGGRPRAHLAWSSGTSPDDAGGAARKVLLEETGAAGGNLNASLAQDQEPGASVENAQAYNGNLVRRILEGRTGTPLRPDADMDVYIFALFNENLKEGPESERNFGLFYPDGRKVYDVNFRPSWCVANEAAGWEKIQAALDWACGVGGADCRPIQPGAPCFEPNTLVAHASYAMNSYYQRHGRDAGDCDFNGAGRIVYQRPRYGNCELPSSR